MTHALTSFTDRFIRMRARTVAPVDKRARVTGVARLNSRHLGRRANPDLLADSQAHSLIERLRIAWHNRRVRRRWQRELSALDDRALRDVGVNRAEAEHAIYKATQRPGVWI